MFSRFSTEPKQAVKTSAPAAPVKQETAAPAQPVSSEKGEMRRTRLAEIKLNLHKVLLET